MTGPTYAGVDVAAVTALVEHVADTVVTPRFRALRDGEVSEKSPGDLVTVVDLEAERALAEGLAGLDAGIPVIGEEGVAADASVLDLLRSDLVWLVDPIDGTHAFVHGQPDHAVMVALVQKGEPVAGWICLPQHGRTFVASRGGGAWVNGRRLTRGAADLTALRGGIATRFLPRADPGLPGGVHERVERGIPELGPGARASDRLWSGATYARIASGEDDFAFYWLTQPWDHSPGSVLVRELGGVSVRLDGSDYRADDDVVGLVVAASAEVAEHVVRRLNPLG